MAMARSSPLLQNLASRVRDLRLEQSLTAREAAKRAGLSIRFFHHLEAGTANISITKLAAVAEALRTPLSELFLREAKPTVALLGLRGGGKSTIGPKLGKSMGCPFIELDDRIESTASLPLTKIFTLHGERYYRNLETQCLREIISERTRCIVALPGGLVMNTEIYASIRNLCTTVWLRAKPEDHMNRVYLQGDTRPMANRKNAMDELRSILKDREPMYGMADITVNTSAHSPSQAAQIVRAELLKRGWA
ncbi:MAG: helix-turn-helix domain-containing protein [Planctomycetota bacterium]|nr:helix-turn-helix domain-containing protein [Planctomycetota bacterium]